MEVRVGAEGGGMVMMNLLQVEGWWSLAGCEEGGRRWLGVVFDWVDQGSTFDPRFYYKGVGPKLGRWAFG